MEIFCQTQKIEIETKTKKTPTAIAPPEPDASAVRAAFSPPPNPQTSFLPCLLRPSDKLFFFSPPRRLIDFRSSLIPTRRGGGGGGGGSDQLGVLLRQPLERQGLLVLHHPSLLEVRDLYAVGRTRRLADLNR